MTTLLNLLHRDKLSALSLPHLGGDGPKSTKTTQPTMANQQCFIAKPTHLGRQDERRAAVKDASTSRCIEIIGVQVSQSPMPATWLCPRFP